MPPKRGSKRSAEAPAVEEPASKKAGEATAKKLTEALKQYGVTKYNYNIIMGALAHPVVDELGLPKDCRRMLEAMVLHSICVPADERHPQQHQAVGQLGEIFSDLRERLENAVAAKEEELQALTASQDEPMAKVQEAEAALESAAAETNARKLALAEATKALLAARSNVTEKQVERQRNDAASVEAKGEKEKLEAVMENDFRALKDGTQEDGTDKGHFDAVFALVGKLKLDESLASALSSSLIKKPAERGEFDNLVVQQLESAIEARASELGEALAAAEPRATECAEAMSQAQQDLETAAGVQRTAAEDLSAAQEKQSQVAVDVSTAKAAAANVIPELKKMEALRDEKKQALEDFEAQHLACFNLLKDRVSARRQKELALEAAASAMPQDGPTLQEAASAGA